MIWTKLQNQICSAIAGTFPTSQTRQMHLWWGLCEMEYTPKQPSNQKVKHVHRFCPLKSRGIWIIWRWNTRHPHEGPPSALWEVQIRSKEQPAWGKPMAFDQQSLGFFELFLQHFPSSKVSKEDQSGGLIWIYLDQVKPKLPRATFEHRCLVDCF